MVNFMFMTPARGPASLDGWGGGVCKGGTGVALYTKFSTFYWGMWNCLYRWTWLYIISRLRHWSSDSQILSSNPPKTFFERLENILLKVIFSPIRYISFAFWTSIFIILCFRFYYQTIFIWFEKLNQAVIIHLKTNYNFDNIHQHTVH